MLSKEMLCYIFFNLAWNCSAMSSDTIQLEIAQMVFISPDDGRNALLDLLNDSRGEIASFRCN